MDDRSAKINIGGREFELILTTRATKEIAGRYGGLENLGQKLMRSENFEMALDELVWLITLLANQSVLIHNLRTPEDKQALLTQETVELLTSPLELAEYKSAIMEAMFKGTKRNVESENDSKTRRSGNRRGTVHPAFLLWNGAAASSVRGGLADAVRFSPRPVGMPQAVPRYGEAETGAFHRRYYPTRTVRRRST